MKHKNLLRTALLLLVAFLPMVLMANVKSVSGRVTDSAGVPIAGVVVTSEGSGISTITDNGGNFTLSVQVKEPALLFQMAGMEDMRVQLDGNQANLEVRMTAIGYGDLAWKELSSSVSSVCSAKLTERPTAFTVTQALAGKVAGLMTRSTSGFPGGTNSVNIRGYGSVNNGSSPLYVVDGVIDVDIEMLNPNDIESVEVLKDAAATAIYGARGANGVVLITTKRGDNSEGSVTYSGFVGLSQYSRAYTEWENAYQKGLSHGHNLSFSKANDRNKVYAALGYQSMGGIVKSTDVNRLNAALNFTSRINNWLDVRFGADFSSRNQTRGDYVFDDLVYKSALGDQTPSQYDYMTMLDKAVYRQKDQQVLLNAAGDVHLTKDLKFTVRGDYHTNYFILGQSAPGGIAGATVEDNGFANISNADVSRWSNEDYFTLDKTFGKLKTTSVLGVSFSSTHFENSYGGTTDFSDNQYEYYRMQAGTVYDQAESGYVKRMMRSGFFRTNMALDGKYLFGVTLRYDSTSCYGYDNMNGFFPAVSVGWIVSEEPWFELFSNSVDFLKIRGSYGSVGNSYVPVTADTANKALKWEDAGQANMGFDLSLWKGKVNLTADLYNVDTHNSFYPTLIPGENGPYTSWTNLGLVRNTGLDVTLNVRPVDQNDFKWNIDFIYSLVNTKAVELGASRVENSLSPIISVEGDDMNTLAVNNDVIGRVTPRNEFNLVNTFNLKGFTLLVDLMAKTGFWTYCDSWNTKYTANEFGAPWTGQYDAKYTYKGDFLRLRNVSLTYDFGRDVLKSARFFRGAVVGVHAENLYTSTGVPSIDPEDFVWNGKVGVSGGAYPRPMTISGSLKLTF